MFFQDIIFKLQNYWNDQGCVIIQPLDTEVGAGTAHPATMLKSLDEKEWNVAYVQPCRRPADGRYGENPNRMQHYYQFQVLMKPSPDNLQQLCVDSLKLLGITPKLHDIRFVHSDWENPSLGAWGLGWEVWCNGMEIIQFTYMQQVGGIACKMIPGEITYGLERLAMYIQDKKSVWDLVWNSSGITYRDIYLEQEKEFCHYNFEGKDTEILIQQFHDNEKIINQLLDDNLVYPAYSYCLKSSHIFNILEARGVLGVTERASYILKTRTLAKKCCAKFVDKYKA
ncbi:MAG: glycyl-tRNA synthetase alpha chain [Candidatus Midichloriaceae bacterium]|jgi:glycyl-tRNA synthetase alpha chain